MGFPTCVTFLKHVLPGKTNPNWREMRGKQKGQVGNAHSDTPGARVNANACSRKIRVFWNSLLFLVGTVFAVTPERIVTINYYITK